MMVDNAGRVWVSEAAGVLNEIDVKNGSIRHYDMLSDTKNRYTFYLTVDNKGLIWKGTAAGIELIDPANGMAKLINQSAGLVGNVILSCTPDDYNRMWVATIQGLNIIDQNAETVHPLANTGIVSMLEDAVGNLWVATQKGVSIINFQKNTLKSLDKSHGLSNDFVQSFMKMNGNILVATNGGFNIIDPVRKTMETAGKNEGLVSDTIYSAFKDRAGNIWLTGPSNGVDMIDSAKKIIRHVDIAGGLSDNNIQDIKEDNNGLIWLGTSKGGVSVIDPVKNTVRYLNDQPGLKDTCNRVLLLDKYGRMWIGTDKGIYVADTKKGTITPITTKEGLTHNHILSLLEYNGAVIAGTNSKITMITAPSAEQKATSGEWKITPLDKSQSLIKETNSWASDFITSKGKYMWGDLGITIINDIRPPADSAVTYITGINVMTQPQRFINEFEFKEKDTLWTADTFYVKGQSLGKTGYTISKKITWDSVSGPHNMPVKNGVQLAPTPSLKII
jgi:ligand-binding sensor domain-containing protein